MTPIRFMRYEEEPSIVKGLRWLCEYLLAQKLRRPLVMYEVGTCAGEAAEVFARYFDEVHCIDVFDSSCGGNLSPYTWAEIEESFDQRAWIAGNIHKHKGLSEHLATDVEDQSLYFVYIDAGHSYAEVTKDLQAWIPKVKPGGWIGGHDFNYSQPGVTRAVMEAFPGSDIQGNNVFHFQDGNPIRIFPDSSWLVRKED